MGFESIASANWATGALMLVTAYCTAIGSYKTPARRLRQHLVGIHDFNLHSVPHQTVTELADHDWISVEGGFPVDDVLLSISAATGVAPRVTQRMLDFTTIEALVAHGHGIALMPRFAVRHPGVKRLVLKGVRAARVYEALARPRSRAAVQQVVDHLRGVGADQG